MFCPGVGRCFQDGKGLPTREVGGLAVSNLKTKVAPQVVEMLTQGVRSRGMRYLISHEKAWVVMS